VIRGAAGCDAVAQRIYHVAVTFPALADWTGPDGAGISAVTRRFCHFPWESPLDLGGHCSPFRQLAQLQKMVDHYCQ